MRGWSFPMEYALSLLLKNKVTWCKLSRLTRPIEISHVRSMLPTM